MSELGKRTKLQEKERIYSYPDGSKVILKNVTELIVSDSGNHRLKASGRLHIVLAGFNHIEIDEEEWTI